MVRRLDIQPVVFVRSSSGAHTAQAQTSSLAVGGEGSHCLLFINDQIEADDTQFSGGVFEILGPKMTDTDAFNYQFRNLELREPA